MTLRQIDDGVIGGEAVDARLDAVLKRPEIRRLDHTVRASLAAYRRLLDSVRAEIESARAATADAKTWPRPFKLKKGVKHWLGPGRLLAPGETILLGKSSYLACQDRFEPAGPGDPPPVNAA